MVYGKQQSVILALFLISSLFMPYLLSEAYGDRFSTIEKKSVNIIFRSTSNLEKYLTKKDTSITEL